MRRFFLTILLVLSGCVIFGFSQVPEPQAALSVSIADVTASPSPTPTSTPKISFARNVVHDQKSIWLSPFHLKRGDAKWLAPLAAATAALVITDRRTSAWVDRNGSLPQASRDVSFAGSVYATGGTVAGLYLLGSAVHNRRARETGFLAAEALLDTSIVTEVLKFAAERGRPNDGTGRGLFFKHGSSFPSAIRRALGRWRPSSPASISIGRLSNTALLPLPPRSACPATPDATISFQTSSSAARSDMV